MTVTRARALRNDATECERRLWRHLRRRQRLGCRFRRQVPIAGYVVDFACFEPRLVVELDGGQHAASATRDRIRDTRLAGEGFRVLRYWNSDVMENLGGVLEDLERELRALGATGVSRVL
jgi:very-short-patch-repair endonuclease